MKRNMDTVRAILLAVEASPAMDISERALKLPEVPGKDLLYHVALLKDAELIDGIIDKDSNKMPWRFLTIRLTWQGHEWIDVMRDDNMWNKVKEKFIKPGASWTVSLLLEYAKSELRTRLGLPPAP
ncbi:MAG: DUF2513 domain-containing protein [Chthoniobacter sp.]|nr:DUF2513 domain-containing protein [Chthoniobacter sp.]